MGVGLVGKTVSGVSLISSFCSQTQLGIRGEGPGEHIYTFPLSISSCCGGTFQADAVPYLHIISVMIMKICM